MYASCCSAGAPGPHDLATSLALDPETASLLREVAQRKEAAVVAEDFAAAKRLKVLQVRLSATRAPQSMRPAVVTPLQS